MFSISRVLLASLALAAFAPNPALARSAPAPTPAPTPTPVADPAVTRVARQQFLAWQIGAIDPTLYAAPLIPKLTPAKIKDVSNHVAPLGALINVVYIGPFIGQGIPASAHGYIYRMDCTNGNLYQWMIIDAQGKIASIFFRDKLTTETVTEPAHVAPSPPATP